MNQNSEEKISNHEKKGLVKKTSNFSSIVKTLAEMQVVQ